MKKEMERGEKERTEEAWKISLTSSLYLQYKDWLFTVPVYIMKNFPYRRRMPPTLSTLHGQHPYNKMYIWKCMMFN